MAKVAFKRGPQANLAALKNNAQDGVFYLTTDTSRLYVGQGTELVELNKSITIVPTINDLPKTGVDEGQFYYVSEPQNILCVYTNGGWVQVNPDTNTDTAVASFEIARTSATDEAITYTWTLYQEVNGVRQATPLTGTFTVASSDIIQLAGVEVGVSASAPEAGVTTIKTVGGGSDADQKITVSAGDNVQIEGSKDALTISATDSKYYVTSEAGDTTIAIINDEVSSDRSSVALKGDSYISIDGSVEDELQVKHNTKSGLVTSTTYGDASVTAGQKTFNIPSVTVDAAGHISSAKNTLITLPDDQDHYVDKVEVSADNNGGITVTVTDITGTKVASGTSAADVYHKITVDGTEQTVYNQNSLGSFYSANQIDVLMRGINAMVYRGKVGGTDAEIEDLPTSSTTDLPVQIGDTYMAGADGTYAGHILASAGDLFIANGTEGADGTISGSVTWDHVKAGLDVNTTYTFIVGSSSTPNSAQLQLIDNDNNYQRINVVGDDKILVSTDADNKLEIEHATSGVTAGRYGQLADATVSYGGTFKVPNFTVDATGHATAAAETTITLPTLVDTKYELIGDAATNTVTLKENEAASKGTITVVGGVATDVSLIADGSYSNDSKFTVSHANVSHTTTDAGTAGVGYGGSIPVVSGVTVNAQGHITDIETKTYTLPTAPVTYTYEGNIETAMGGITITDTLVDSNSAKHGETVRTFTSESLQIVEASANNVTIELEWGTF